ncbi:unnamed protein product [Taenia asiatica]|uniref:Uncharacterized protein n=1 Tax=Taenia asiatica TaxID=60517 RepID=A0A3P6PD26_TAEAS|nr:unnamed protein product [Taenia asiatica]
MLFRATHERFTFYVANWVLQNPTITPTRYSSQIYRTVLLMGQESPYDNNSVIDRCYLICNTSAGS